ncbi:hypothetical protein GCM10019059_01310 [Camelimonas fluminis]|nr:hypothetical protein GCM10019059_01310 [Camelimonas fluminis]
MSRAQFTAGRHARWTCPLDNALADDDLGPAVSRRKQRREPAGAAAGEARALLPILQKKGGPKAPRSPE